MSAVFPPLEESGFAPSLPQSDQQVAQLRVPPHRARIELKGAVGRVLARVNEELAGVMKSAWNFQNVIASCGAP